MNELKAILIDPTTRTIKDTVVDYDLQAWYDKLDCDTIQITTIPLEAGRFQMIIDEEGLFKPELDQFRFEEVFAQQYAGKALLVQFEESEDEDGNVVIKDNMDATAEDVEDSVVWCDQKMVLE